MAPVAADEITEAHHGEHGDGEEDEAGVVVIEPAGDLRAPPFRHQHHGKEAGDIADQGEKDGAAENEKLLPRLKAAGKTVIAVSHDDRWFNAADKVVWMEEGKVERVMTTAVDR